MVMAGFCFVKGGGEIQDHLAALRSDDAAIGKAPTVEIRRDIVAAGMILAAATQKISVQRMNASVVWNRLYGSNEGLRHHLAAKNAPDTAVLAPPLEQTVTSGTNIQQPQQILHPLVRSAGMKFYRVHARVTAFRGWAGATAPPESAYISPGVHIGKPLSSQHRPPRYPGVPKLRFLQLLREALRL